MFRPATQESDRVAAIKYSPDGVGVPLFNDNYGHNNDGHKKDGHK